MLRRVTKFLWFLKLQYEEISDVLVKITRKFSIFHKRSKLRDFSKFGENCCVLPQETRLVLGLPECCEVMVNEVRES